MARAVAVVVRGGGLETAGKRRPGMKLRSCQVACHPRSGAVERRIAHAGMSGRSLRVILGTYVLASRHVPQLRSQLLALGWKGQKVRPLARKVRRCEASVLTPTVTTKLNLGRSQFIRTPHSSQDERLHQIH